MSQYPPPSSPQPNYAGPTAPQTNGMAIASLVLGIISLFFCIWYVAIPCGILAIIFGVMGGNKAKQGQGSGGMARTGLILGCVGLAIDVVIVILIFTVGVSFMHWAQKQQQQMQQQQQNQQSQPAPSPTTSGARLLIPGHTFPAEYLSGGIERIA